MGYVLWHIKKEKNMKQTGALILQLSLIILAFAGCWFGYSYINQVSAYTGEGFLWVLGVIFVTIASAVIGIFLNIILHEAGHLTGGLLTGYGFIFFNVLNLTIIKENGKLVRKKYRIAGTGGGCMLSPPNMVNGTFHYKLYISGGFLVNFLICIICIFLFYYLADTSDFLARGFLVIGISGAFFGLINFIPNNVVLPNDGYIFFNLGREKNAVMRQGYWSASRTQALIAEGTRPRDIPKELFDWVDIDNICDPFALDTARNNYNFLLDRQELIEARKLMQGICNNSHRFPDMMKLSLYCELLFHELMGECRQEEIERLYDKNLKDYIKAAHSEICVQRLMYAYALLFLKDTVKANEYLDLFHKACTKPLQSAFLSGEQELITLINTIADKRNN
jgi:hypothetical protein